MVRRALNRSVLRDIGGSLGRYLAILLIIALGVGFFAGLRSAQPDMVETGREYLTGHRFQDFRLLSSLGFVPEDVEAFRAMPGITGAAGGYTQDFLCQDDAGGRQVLRAHSLSEEVDLPSLKAGRMPQSPGECLADARVFGEEDLGTVIALSPENSRETRQALAADSFTIVGIAQSPRYLNYERGTTSLGNGSVAGFVLLLPEAFSLEAYTELLLTADLPQEIYTPAYEDARDALKPQVEALLARRGQQRLEDLREQGRQELEKARTELEEGRRELQQERLRAEQELSQAWEKLEQGRQALEENRKKLTQGEQALTQARTELARQEQQLRDSQEEISRREAELERGWSAFRQGEQQMETQRTQLAEARETLESQRRETLDPLYAQRETLEDSIARLEQALANAPAGQQEALRRQLSEAQAGLRQVQAGIAQAEAALDAAQAELAAGEQALAAGVAQLDQQRRQLEAGQAALEEGKAQLTAGQTALTAGKEELSRQAAVLEEGKADLAAGWQELERGQEDYEAARQDAQRQLDQAQQELDRGEDSLIQGENDLAQLAAPETYVLDRGDNVGYLCFENDTAIVQAISVVFPLFFFLVAAFVCVTTMKRMVEERRTQTGVLKALGYENRQIVGGFLFYAGSAAVVGWLAGYGVGVPVIPRVIWSVYGIMYGFAPLKDVFSPGLFLLCLAAALVCSCGTVLLVCRGELRETAASLIRPKSARAGKTILLERVRPLWRRMSFLKKVAARNIFRYKNRLLMMLMGIGGCTALLLTGFGIRDSIQDIVALQYEQVQHYQFTVTFTGEPEKETLSQAAAAEGVGQTLLLHQSTLEVQSGDGVKSVQLLVSSQADFQGLMDFHMGQEQLAMPGLGQALISQGLADRLKLAPGETFSLCLDGGRRAPVTVSGIFENYVYDDVVLSQETYRQVFGAAPEYQTLLLRSDGSRPDHEVGAALAALPGVGSVQVSQDFAQRMHDMLGSLNGIVVMVVLCAAALAFIVLYHLTNINITERTREIATLKVLGFYPRETASYIFREMLVLSAMGAAVGIPLGLLLHRFVMSQIQVDMITFPVKVLPGSIALSLGLTLLFALCLSLVMRPRLEKIDMVESLKSVE